MVVIQVGLYPPPFGGTSIHNERLTRYCEQRGIDTTFIDPGGYDRAIGRGVLPPPAHRIGGPPPIRYWKLWRLTRRHRKAVAHIHISAFGTFAIAGYPMVRLFNGRSTILSIQNGNLVEVYTNAPPWRRALIRRIIHRVDVVVVTQAWHAAFLRETLDVSDDRVRVIPSFIPISPAPVEACQPALNQIQVLRERYRNLIVVSGQILDLYGLEPFMEALSSLRTREPWGFVLALYRGVKPPDSDLERRVFQEAARLGNGLIVRDLRAEVFVRVLQECRAFVRPTTMEGDSNALREAAAAGLQIVASDCAPRLPGVALFTTGDSKDLARAIDRCLSDPMYGLASERQDGNGERFVTMYRDLWEMRYGSKSSAE
jgi:glycosyltransferase involved in cell wall biosynthesis